MDNCSVAGSGGGTLRRKAWRNKKSLDNEQKISENSCPEDFGFSHEAADPLSTAFEATMSMSTMLEEETLPLPPPPRVDSVTSLDDIDMLPPPPPDMCINTSHYQVSAPVSPPMVRTPPCPAPKPVTPNKQIQNSTVSTLKKTGGTMQKPSRRISFDDHVQMIEAPRTSPSPTHLPPQQQPYNQPSANIIAEPILKYSPQGPIRNNPKKLSANENYNSLPRTFLDNLQKVMSKKWQVAEKCRQNESTSPYEVLGFRDEPINNVGQPNMYSKNSAIGAWVLETQMYAQTPTNNFYQQQQHHHHHHPGHHLQHQQQHPCYQVENAQPHGQSYQVPELNDYNQQQNSIYSSRQHQQQLQQQQYQHQPQLVVLREPEPSYVDPSRLRANKVKRPPPPPRRSENTQLSNNVI